jgi:hypothetical protein
MEITMKLHHAFAVLVATGGFSGPVLAGESAQAPDMERFRYMVKPADVDLFFNYLRVVMKAGLEGKTPPPPPSQLSQRAYELAESLRKEGVASMDQMLEMMRQEIKESLPPPEPSDAPANNSKIPPDDRT